MKLTLKLAFFSLLLSGCHTAEKFPEAKDVKMGSNVPSKDCREIGIIRGRSQSKTPNIIEAMTDLKTEAANKGANYVQIKEKSGYGTEVVGVAFYCP